MAKFKFDWDKVKQDIKDGEKKGGFKKDERFWKPTVDDKGNATAVIRFLPDPNGNPWVKLYTHNFSYMNDGVKKYWINNCVNTFGYDRECPICKKNQEYWNSAFEADKKIASLRKRKLEYIANIVVLKNPAHPEDEGKVFLYKFGEKIYGKIKEKMFPSEEMKALGEGMYEEFVPFDLYEGAHFILVQTKQGDYPNYDSSKFDKVKPLGSDKVIESVMGRVYDTSEFIAEDKFPTNEKVIEVLGSLLGIAQAGKSAPTAPVADKSDEGIEDITSGSIDDLADDFPESFTGKQPEAETNDEAPAASDDEDADFFRNLR